MRHSRRYPITISIVEVTYVDGEVKEFRLSASPAIASYLAREAAASGMLVLRDDTTRTSVCIPVGQIRHMAIREVEDGQETTAEAEAPSGEGEAPGDDLP